VSTSTFLSVVVLVLVLVLVLVSGGDPAAPAGASTRGRPER